MNTRRKRGRGEGGTNLCEKKDEAQNSFRQPEGGKSQIRGKAYHGSSTLSGGIFFLVMQFTIGESVKMLLPPGVSGGKVNSRE